MSSAKEPHFFSFQDRMARGTGWHDALFESAPMGVEIYGESSTTYSVWEPALVKIKQELTDPRIILILREPLERLLSHYRWMYALGLERDSLPRALTRERNAPVRPELSRSGCYPWYRRCSNYSHFVPLIELIFGKENVLVLKSEELSRNPSLTLSRCFEFLNVEEFDVGSELKRFNETSSKEVSRLIAFSRYYHYLPASIRGTLAAPTDAVKKIFGKTKLVAPTPSPEFIKDLGQELSQDRLIYECF
jgi:hypothetical protein